MGMLALLFVAGLSAVAADEPSPSIPPPLSLPRASGPIVIDGDI
jgi:hypothetical protein